MDSFFPAAAPLRYSQRFGISLNPINMFRAVIAGAVYHRSVRGYGLPAQRFLRKLIPGILTGWWIWTASSRSRARHSYLRSLSAPRPNPIRRYSASLDFA